MFPQLAAVDAGIARAKLTAEAVAAPSADMEAPFTADLLLPGMAATDTMPVSAGIAANDASPGARGLEDLDLTVDLLHGLWPLNFDELRLL